MEARCWDAVELPARVSWLVARPYRGWRLRLHGYGRQLDTGCC